MVYRSQNLLGLWKSAGKFHKLRCSAKMTCSFSVKTAIRSTDNQKEINNFSHVRQKVAYVFLLSCFPA